MKLFLKSLICIQILFQFQIFVNNPLEPFHTYKKALKDYQLSMKNIINVQIYDD